MKILGLLLLLSYIASAPFETSRVVPFRTSLPQGEPELLADPDGHVVVVWMRGSPRNLRNLTLLSAYSADGGRTFTSPKPIQQGLWLADPTLARAPDGTLLLGALRKDSVPWEDVAVVLFRSTDHGKTWSLHTVLRDDDLFYDRPWIAVDPTNRLHAVFTLRASGSRRTILYTSSRGKTFPPPRRVGPGGAMGLSVTPDGTLWLLAQSGRQGLLYIRRPGRDDFLPLVFTSPRLGLAWRTSAVFSERRETFPRMAVYTDPAGQSSIYVLWIGETSGRHGLYLSRLPSGASSFARPVLIKEGPPGSFRLPALTVDPRGTIHLFWYERSPDADTWRLMYASRNPDLPPQPLSFSFPIHRWPGEFLSATSTRSAVLVAWVVPDGPRRGLYVSARRAPEAKRLTSGLPSQEEMVQWIRDLVAFGPRRPGTEGDRMAEDYIARKFREFGLRVDFDTIPLTIWDREPCLIVLQTKPRRVVPCFAAPYSGFTPPDGLLAPLADLGDGSGPLPELRGKIALLEVRFRPLFRRDLRKFLFDPRKTLPPEHQHPALRFRGSPNLARGYRRAVQSGALAVVGILDAPASLHTFFAPYPDPEEIPFPIPLVYISKDAGRLLKAELESGPLRVRLLSSGSTPPGVTRNIIGVLPGARRQIVLISTHHDSPFAGAVQDASGLAVLLALARALSRIPPEERPHTYWFAATAAHFYGAKGIRTLLRNHEYLRERVLLSIHVEHIAREFEEKDGRLVATGYPEPAFWFISDIPGLLPLAREVVRQENLERTFLLPLTEGRQPAGESLLPFLYDIPVLGITSLPVYLLFQQDSLEKVAVERLVPTARALATLLWLLPERLRPQKGRPAEMSPRRSSRHPNSSHRTRRKTHKP